MAETAPWIRTKPTCAVIATMPERVIVSASVIVPVTIAWM